MTGSRVFKTLALVIYVCGAIASPLLALGLWHAAWLESAPWAVWPLVVCVMVYPILNLRDGTTLTYVMNAYGTLHPTYSGCADRIRRACRRARECICIADTYLGGFDGFREDLQAFLNHNRRGRVRILLADPEGHLVRARGTFSDQELVQMIGGTVAQIRAFQKHLGTEGGAERIEVRYFDRLIPGPLFVVDRKSVFCGQYLQVDGSQHAPMMELPGWLPIEDQGRRRLIESVEVLWQASKDTKSSR